MYNVSGFEILNSDNHTSEHEKQNIIKEELKYATYRECHNMTILSNIVIIDGSSK